MRRFFQHALFRVLSFNAILVLVRLVTSFIAIKAMSLLIGPSGIALMGNFRSFLTGVQSLASLGIQDGIVKFISEKKEDKEALKKVFSTSLCIVGVSSLGVSLCIMLGAESLNAYLFPGKLYVVVLRLVALLLPIVVFNMFLLAVLNGFHRYKSIIVINIMANVLGLVLLLFFMQHYAVVGALSAVIIGEAAVVVITLFFSWRSVSGLFRGMQYSGGYTRRFMSYSLMALVTAIVMPVTFIAVRNSITAQLSLTDAGYWEALHRFSGMYMIFVTSGLSLYYFPRLAALQKTTAFKGEVIDYYKVLVPIFLLMALLIYGLRDWMITFVLNRDFMVISPLMIWQLLGDSLKVMSLAFGYQILAKAMVKKYIVIEVLFGMLFYILSSLFIEFYGLSGVVKAYAVAHGVMLLCMIFFFRKTIVAIFKGLYSQI